MRIPFALVIAAMLIAPPAWAEDTICTPDHYYNWLEPEPLVIAIDAARAAGSWVTVVDIETGAYGHRRIGDTAITQTGTFAILNPGSLRERIDFAAVDQQSGLTLRISLIDQDMPFVRVGADGTVASGHCAYEYDMVQK